MSVTDLSFGTNNITVYQYEPFWYRVSNPYYPLIPTLTQTGGIPSSTLKIDLSGRTDFSTNTGLVVNPSSNENFILDISSGTYRSSNFVTIGAGRFRDSNLQGLTGQTFNFYKNEPIQDVSLVLGFGTSNIYSVPALPPGLSIVSNTSTTWRITGTPTFQVASNNYQFIATNTGRTATSTVNIAVNPERILVNVSGSPIISNMQIGTTIPSRVFTTPYSYSPLTYTWGTPPDGILFKNSVGTNVTSPFTPSDASRTLIVTGAPTITAAQSFIASGVSSKTIPVVASKSTITNSNALTFAFGETVLFSDASFDRFFVSVPIDPSQNSISAATYFSSNVPISNIISTNLRSDLSTVFVYSQQRAYITGTPTAPTGTSNFTFRAVNTNAISRDTTASIVISNDAVTITKNVVDNCFNFILSRDLASNKTGYYSYPIQFTANAASGRSVTFSSTGLTSGLSLSNVNSNTVRLVGIPETIESLRNLKVKATTATNISGSIDVSFAVLDDVFTFPTIQDASLTFFCGREITPLRFNITTLSERPITAFTTSNLPSGLFLSTQGVLSGTPLQSTSIRSSFTVTAYTSYTSKSANYNYRLLSDEIIIETVKDSYSIPTTETFGPIAIESQTYSGSNVSLSIASDITPYQGLQSITANITNNELIGDLSQVDYLFPGYNFQIKGDSTVANARIDVANAPTPRHIGLANNGSLKVLDQQSFRDTGDVYFLGSTDSGNSSTWKLGELLFYDRAVTTDEREKIEGYLAWKWGLQANLPIGHPYKNNYPNPFSPTQISNCYMWFDANDEATITKNVSSNVLSWNSRVSGLTAVFNVSNTTGSITPVAPLTDVSTIGTKNAVYFANNASRLEISNIAPQQQPKSVFAVAQFVSKSGTSYTRNILGNTDTNQFLFGLGLDSTIYSAGIYPSRIAGAGAVTSELTDATGTSPFCLAVINSDVVGSNYVAYTGNTSSIYDFSKTGVAKYYATNGIALSIPLQWSNVLSNVWDVKQTSNSVLAVTPTTVYRSSNNGTTWTDTGLTSNYYTRALTDGSSQFLVFGFSNTDLSGTNGKLFVSSNNGTSWTSNNISNRFTNMPVTAGTYASNRYFLGTAGTYTPIMMLGGSNTTLAYSPDGFHWKSLGTYAYTGQTYAGVHTNNNIWLIGGNDSNAPIQYSYDGLFWTRASLSGFKCYAITHNDKETVAGGSDSKLIYSSDDINWNDVRYTGSGFSDIYTLASTTNGFIAGGTTVSSNAKLLYSVDGTDWYDASGSLPITTSVYGVSMLGSSAIAVGEGTTTLAYSSNLGQSWTTIDPSSYVFNTRGRAVANNGTNRWVAVGEDGACTIVVSGDGFTWYGIAGTASLIPYPLTVTSLGSSSWLVGGSASNSNVSLVYSSDNGSSWSRIFEKPYMGEFVRNIVLGDPVTSSSLWYADSSNLSVWTPKDTSLNIMYDIVQGGSNLVAVGRGSETMIRSVDNGITWTPVNTGITGEITSVQYANGIWAVVGTSGRQSLFRYSSNLSSWSTGFSNSSSAAITGGLLFDGNSWTTSIVGLYPSYPTSTNTYLYPYHTAKKTDIDSNWLSLENPYVGGSNYTQLQNETFFDRYLFRVVSNGTPTATFSIPSSSGSLQFTSPTQTSYLFYQYVPITPITITATGIEDFGYFYAVGLPRGLSIVPNPDGQTAQIIGTPVIPDENGSPVYIYLRNGIYTTVLVLNIKIIIPRVLRQQTSAGAYTSLVRQYTEVNAAQNAINSRVYPAEERALGEFMAPEAPDNTKEDTACKKC